MFNYLLSIHSEYRGFYPFNTIKNLKINANSPQEAADIANETWPGYSAYEVKLA